MLQNQKILTKNKHGSRSVSHTQVEVNLKCSETTLKIPPTPKKKNKEVTQEHGPEQM